MEYWLYILWNDYERTIISGNCEIDQIYKIFQGLGTPDDRIWPGCQNFPDFKKNFPKWGRKEFEIKLNRFEEQAGTDARNLLNSMITYIS